MSQRVEPITVSSARSVAVKPVSSVALAPGGSRPDPAKNISKAISTGATRSVERQTQAPRRRTWVEGPHASVSGLLGAGTAGGSGATSALPTCRLIRFFGRAGAFRLAAGWNSSSSGASFRSCGMGRKRYSTPGGQRPGEER